MAWIKELDGSELTPMGVRWDKVDMVYCWLSRAMDKRSTVVFDDKHIDKVRRFIEENKSLAERLTVVEGDLIESTGYRYDEDTKRCLCWATPITLDGRSAHVSGVKLTFGIVSTRKLPHREFEWSWEAIRGIICKGGQFISGR